MEENEKELDNNEEELETSDESTDESNLDEVEETNEEDDSNTPSLEDYERIKKENETLKAQKEHWRKKVGKQPLNKPNETQSGLTKDEVILYAKGHTEDEVELAKKLASLSGISPLKATEDEIFKSKVNSRIKKEKSEQASLPASNASGRFKTEKPVGKMTKEEHQEYFKKVMSQV
jgi:hypothetical protein